MKFLIPLFFCCTCNLQAVVILNPGSAVFSSEIAIPAEPSILGMPKVFTVRGDITPASIFRVPRFNFAFGVPIATLSFLLMNRGLQNNCISEQEHRSNYFRNILLAAIGFLGMSAAEEIKREKLCLFKITFYDMLSKQIKLEFEDCKAFDERIFISAYHFHQNNISNSINSIGAERQINATENFAENKRIAINEDETLYTIHALNNADHAIYIESFRKTITAIPLSLYIIYNSNNHDYYFVSTDYSNNIQLMRYQ